MARKITLMEAPPEFSYMALLFKRCIGEDVGMESIHYNAYHPAVIDGMGVNYYVFREGNHIGNLHAYVSFGYVTLVSEDSDSITTLKPFIVQNGSHITWIKYNVVDGQSTEELCEKLTEDYNSILDIVCSAFQTYNN